MNSRRMLERSNHGQNRKGLGLTPHESMTKVTPFELLSKDNSLGLPLGLFMTPNCVIFFLYSSSFFFDAFTR